MARAERAPRASGLRTDRRPGGRRKPPAPTVILFVRHGSTATTGTELPGRASGLHLSDAGRAQAESVAARIAAVYSSPLERTRETAAPIAQATGCQVQVEDGLVELDIGEWTGLDLKAARKRPEWATIQRYPSGFSFPGGESFVDMQARIVACVDRLRSAHPGETLVAVSHADPIRAAVAHAMGTHLDLFQRVVVSPCSLTAVAYAAGGPVVLTVNSSVETGGALVPS
jgi:probable phosphomutase (TIGR03848 family)